MEQDYIVYHELSHPDEQFVSCIGGRVLCAVRYLLEDPDNSALFSYLRQCRLCYLPLTEARMEDPWYYQPLEILTAQGNAVFSREGIRELDFFMQGLGLRIQSVELPDPKTLFSAINRAFVQNAVLVLNIDQYYHPKSEKYHKQKNAWHALLLKGFCPKSGEVLISDSAHGKEYLLPFSAIAQMCIGSGYLLTKEDREPVSSRSWAFDWEQQFEAPVSRFLTEIRDKLSRECNPQRTEYLGYGYCYTIKYAVIPFLKMAVNEESEQDQWKTRLKAFEHLSTLLLKTAVSKTCSWVKIGHVISDCENRL